MNLAVIPLIALSLCIAGCASPETTRTRGGGPGADIGNRDKVVQMHEGAQAVLKKLRRSFPPSIRL